MRKFKISVLLKLGFYCLFLSIGLEMQARKFVHPGILHTTKSIERMRAQIADKEYPAYGSFELLKSQALILLLICLFTTLLTFFATVLTVQGVQKLIRRGN